MNNQTMVFWHGGDLSDIDNTFRQQTKKQEYGPGLYLTTSYNVVKDYVKGSRKLYRVEVSLGNSLEDAEIPYEKVIEFLNKLPKQVLIKVKGSIDKYNRNGFVNAEIINNLFVNYNLLKPEISYKLKEFYLENNIDYSLVNNAFGWGEDMMILFNTNKIINVERIGPKDKIDKFELHKEAMEISKKDLIQNWLNNPKMLREDANFMFEVTKGELEEEKKKKADRCLRIARRKMPQTSAYRSGLIVQCRRGKIWKGLKEEDESLDNYPKELIKKAHDAITRRKGKDYAPDVHELQAWIDNNQESLDEKTDFSKEKEQGLHGWFARQGGSGKSKGWVDCNTCRTVDGKKKCKSCGRKEGESRAKYPACRPTPSACGSKGKGKSWGKKS